VTNRVVFLCSTFLMILSSARLPDVVRIPMGRAAGIDGMVGPHEWDDAESTEITVDHDWKVEG